MRIAFSALEEASGPFLQAEDPKACLVDSGDILMLAYSPLPPFGSSPHLCLSTGELCEESAIIEFYESVCGEMPYSCCVLYFRADKRLLVLPDAFGSTPLFIADDGIVIGEIFEEDMQAVPPGTIASLRTGGGDKSLLLLSCPWYNRRPGQEESLSTLLRRAMWRLIGHKDEHFVLFSGGIDSLLCAVLLCNELRARKGARIYLINTAFMVAQDGDRCRDRTSAVEMHAMLREKYPGLEVALIRNDVTREDVLRHAERIAKHAGGTTMGFNLTAVHYFGAQKAKGLGGASVVVGTGSDELFMGYSRHRNVCTGDALRAMILQDVSTLWKTNLQRDYCASQWHGVEQFSPFLDRDVARYALARADPEGVGKQEIKHVLRRILGPVDLPPKLAAQFGSGASRVVRSIKCRNTRRCLRGECSALECLQYFRARLMKGAP